MQQETTIADQAVKQLCTQGCQVDLSFSGAIVILDCNQLGYLGMRHSTKFMLQHSIYEMRIVPVGQ